MVRKVASDLTSIDSNHSANARQEGGTHYQQGAGRCPVCNTELQHWDIVIAFGFDYFIGNATKYLFRFGRKGDRKEQLKKAIHYLEKKLEVEEGRK